MDEQVLIRGSQCQELIFNDGAVVCSDSVLLESPGTRLLSNPLRSLLRDSPQIMIRHIYNFRRGDPSL